MYKLMIVEDEPLVRTAIVKSIDFAAYGFEIVAVCEDGQEAADLYFKLFPDLVITDICMPLVNGLELAKIIAVAGRGTRVIIITGFDDFNYARTAISSQVSDYILKPVTAREFKEVLTQARAAIDEQKEKMSQIDSAQRKLYINGPLVRDQIMNRLIQGAAEIRSIADEANSFGLETGKPYYLFLIFQVDNLAEMTRQLNVNTELLNMMITNIVSELSDAVAGTLAFSLTDGKTAIVGWHDRAADLEKILRSLGQTAQETILRTLKVPVTIGIGKTADSLPKLKNSYAEALKCLDYRFLMPGCTIISPQDIKQQDIQFDFSKNDEDILQQVRLQDEAKISLLIENMFLAFRLTYLTRPDIHYACARLVSRLLAGIRLPDDTAGPAVNTVLPAGQGVDYLPRLKEWLIQFCHECILYLRTGRQSSVRRLSAMATQYIKEHYADNNLSLMDLCSHLSVSLSYFSTFFKEETGKTFIEFLTEVRMDKAKELLMNSDLMLYLIAERVGYENPAYFTVAFKKHTGMKPKEFRKAFGRKEER